MHAGHPMGCYPPQSPINGIVYNYTTTLEGLQATYKCDNGFIPSREFKTTCIQLRQWFPNPMELKCTAVEPCKYTTSGQRSKKCL